MFDITSSKLLLLGIVALLVIGPKDFPLLLRTIGKYVGIIRGHAKEFRAQFDEAMREAELTDLKKDMESIAQETEASLRSTEQSVQKSLEEVKTSVDTSLDAAKLDEAFAHDASGLPIAPPPPTAIETATAVEPVSGANGTQSGEQPPPPAADPGETPPPAQTAAEPGRPVEKSGA
jgi:sec-independent protein translocase protein TatB